MGRWDVYHDVHSAMYVHGSLHVLFPCLLFLCWFYLELLLDWTGSFDKHMDLSYVAAVWAFLSIRVFRRIVGCKVLTTHEIWRFEAWGCSLYGLRVSLFGSLRCSYPGNGFGLTILHRRHLVPTPPDGPRTRSGRPAPFKAQERMGFNTGVMIVGVTLWWCPYELPLAGEVSFCF